MKREDLDNANVTTQLPETELNDPYFLALSNAKKKFVNANHHRPAISRGRFTGGAGTADLGDYRINAESWVIFTIRGASDLAAAAGDLMAAWKAAQSLIEQPATEFKIVSHKGTDWIHGVLEIGENLRGGDVSAPLRIANDAMIAMAQHLLGKNYECPPIDNSPSDAR